MNKISRNILFKTFITGLICFSSIQSEEIKLPNDIRWVVNSKEYQLLCNQIYSEAITTLNNIISNNPDLTTSAIILDLDETVLDNSQYQVDNFNTGESFSMES